MFSLKNFPEKKSHKNEKEFTPGNLLSYTQLHISSSVDWKIH